MGKNACLNSVLLKVICSSKRITIFGNLLWIVLCCIDAECEKSIRGNPSAEIIGMIVNCQVHFYVDLLH